MFGCHSKFGDEETEIRTGIQFLDFLENIVVTFLRPPDVDRNQRNKDLDQNQHDMEGVVNSTICLLLENEKKLQDQLQKIKDALERSLSMTMNPMSKLSYSSSMGATTGTGTGSLGSLAAIPLETQRALSDALSVFANKTNTKYLLAIGHRPENQHDYANILDDINFKVASRAYINDLHRFYTEGFGWKALLQCVGFDIIRDLLSNSFLFYSLVNHTFNSNRLNLMLECLSQNSKGKKNYVVVCYEL